MPLSMIPAQHRMSTRRGFPDHGMRGSSHVLGGLSADCAGGGAGTAPSSAGAPSACACSSTT